MYVQTCVANSPKPVISALTTPPDLGPPQQLQHRNLDRPRRRPPRRRLSPPPASLCSGPGREPPVVPPPPDRSHVPGVGPKPPHGRGIPRQVYRTHPRPRRLAAEARLRSGSGRHHLGIAVKPVCRLPLPMLLKTLNPPAPWESSPRATKNSAPSLARYSPSCSRTQRKPDASTQSSPPSVRAVTNPYLSGVTQS